VPDWFFLSYARVDDEHRDMALVQQFYRDLTAEVSVRTGDPPEASIGFLDQYDLQTGDPWPDDLGAAVQRSRTFVPIMTGRYFGRPYCGREWQLFEDRIGDAGLDVGRARLIIPIPWAPPEEGEFPLFATDLHDDISLKGRKGVELDGLRDYNEHGMLYVIKRKDHSHKAAYETIVETLAKRIIRTAQQHELPHLTTIRSIRDIPNRFTRDKPVRMAAAQEHASTRAFCVIIAARDSELTREMQVVASRYAEDAESWKPFDPDFPDPIWLVAQRRATEERLMIQFIRADDDLIIRLREAEDANSAAIMVIDPWSTGIARCSGLLKRFDREAFKNCVVLIPWGAASSRDPAVEAKLRADLTMALERRLIGRSRMFLRDEIRTAAQLESEIAAAFREVQVVLAPRREPERETPTSRFTSAPSVGSTG
jgi:FxsC-like protein